MCVCQAWRCLQLVRRPPRRRICLMCSGGVLHSASVKPGVLYGSSGIFHLYLPRLGRVNGAEAVLGAEAVHKTKAVLGEEAVLRTKAVLGAEAVHGTKAVCRAEVVYKHMSGGALDDPFST